MKPLWLYRPLLNWRHVFEWAGEIGIKKMMPPEQLHVTLATVREPCAWGSLELQEDEIVIPAGFKSLQIIGWSCKALTFGDPRIKERHEELRERFPQMDHPLLRPHVTLYRGGKMFHDGYEGELVFGPEIAQEFNAVAGREIKHVKVVEVLDGL